MFTILKPREVLTSLSFGGVYFWVLSHPTVPTTFCTAPNKEVFSPQQNEISGVPGFGSAWEDTPLLVAVSEWLGKLSFETVPSSRWVLSPLPDEQSSCRRQCGICRVSFIYSWIGVTAAFYSSLPPMLQQSISISRLFIFIWSLH
jgi:hypothetical protein